MSQQADNVELNRFVREVDAFMTRYAQFISPETRAAVYATNDPDLIKDYESTRNQGAALKSGIEATTGAWNSAKAFYAAQIGNTSMIIGDAIDEIRSWFGYKPAGGLGALQIPAAVWVAGIIAAAVTLNRAMDSLIVRLDAARIARNTGVSYQDAYKQATDAHRSGLFGGVSVPLIGLGLAALFFLTR